MAAMWNYVGNEEHILLSPVLQTAVTCANSQWHGVYCLILMILASLLSPMLLTVLLNDTENIAKTHEYIYYYNLC